MLRGGFHTLTFSKSIEPLSLVLWTVAVLGNTTCPASDLAMTDFHVEAIDFILNQFRGAVAPFQLCPLPLFGEIIRINHLRMQAVTDDAAEVERFETEGFDILERIHGFSPQQWAETKSAATQNSDWVLMGCVYRAAVALYCILSLQSLSVLPSTQTLRDCCTTHAHLLHFLLSEGLSSPRFQRFMVWPLAVLGVEAVHGCAEMRAFVAEQLPLISRHVGIYVPLAAKRVLESFWASGMTSWDACFDKPYVFTTQIAVDTSRLYSDMSPR
ncbi:hypothetical protein SODALDRAFT_332150 [Sodiomyces alkalinus F11]|uniref:C6 zinc finger domain-containing protein n=1 Tax=Sodiomyces alkalinus (strain CBS 110278 / VKM F-3762 / F11) TaxID=1314773 RepID=A0A3N2PZY5_SODAK|nr:hypothetical protein SODALDRAFT_332150 [Sodiomyces alkalinus F11]ROT39998.1 hypothetical protein SODALDRAFT_332150 [Sodiomyces alkalinus F11]